MIAAFATALIFLLSSSSLASGVPSAPQNVTATPGDGSVVVAWQDPASDGGLAITNFYVFVFLSNNTENIATKSATLNASIHTLTVPELDDGVTYYFAVKAGNSAGRSVLSNLASATPVAVPPSPQTFTIVFFAVVATIGVTIIVFCRYGKKR